MLLRRGLAGSEPAPGSPEEEDWYIEGRPGGQKGVGPHRHDSPKMESVIGIVQVKAFPGLVMVAPPHQDRGALADLGQGTIDQCLLLGSVGPGEEPRNGQQGPSDQGQGHRHDQHGEGDPGQEMPQSPEPL